MKPEPDKIEPKPQKGPAQPASAFRIALMVIIILSSVAIGIYTGLHH